MKALSRDELLAAGAAFDRAASETVGIDVFCTQLAWALAADAALSGGGSSRELVARRGEHGWALFTRRRLTEADALLMPLEAAWFLGSPVVCDGDPDAFAAELASDLQETQPGDVVFLSGLTGGSPLYRALLASFGPGHLLTEAVIPATRRVRASLEGGVAGFLARRTRHFREKLRRAERMAKRAGVSVERVPVATEEDALLLHERLVAIEERSWKGLGGDGLMIQAMADFYRAMLPSLARAGTLRASALVLEGQDVAVIAGGLAASCEGQTFRGLQFSFDDAHRPLSLGNLAQMAMIEALSKEGPEAVVTYDLGSEMDYKKRWGEETMETVTVVAVPRARHAVLRV